MSEKEREQDRNGSSGKIYTGEGYVETGEHTPRAPRHAASDDKRPKRRSEELKEEDAKRRSEELKEEDANRRSVAESEKEKAPRRRSEELKEEEAKRRSVAESEKEKAPRRRSEVPDGTEHAEKSAEKAAIILPFPGKRKSSSRNGLAAFSSYKKILAGLGVIVCIVYVGVAIYFSRHFYAGTSVYGIDCSRKTADEVKTEISEKLGDYVLTIQEREDKSETITADQIDLQYEDDGSIDQMLKVQRSYVWPFMILFGSSKGSPVAFSYNKTMAEQCITQLSCLDSEHMVEPLDAYITPTDTGFEVAPEVMGTTLDETQTMETILTALNDGVTTLSLEEENCYQNPDMTQDDEALQADADAMSALAGAKITLDFGTDQEVIDASVIQKWITKMTNGSYVIDDVCVSDYVESLAAKYDTFGLPIDFYTSSGTTVTLSGGDYGWCLDQNATVIALLEALNEGYRGTMEPVYLYQGMSHENNGIGYTYVEICISKQEMWCYEDGNLIVDTPVVTGNPNKGNATPSGGVWAIDSKERNATLVGEGYSAPVDYWIPFNGNVGIHDLQTRAYFGGTIYLTNGSHGCVNTPYDAVQQIYNTVSVGTPVIVYD